MCYVEECADSDPCDLKADFQPTNITNEIDCLTGVT